MFEQLFENVRRAAEFNIQMQQEACKKWFGMPAACNGASEKVVAVKKEFAELACDLVKKQREALEAQFSAGLGVVEEAFHLTEAKNPEELRARTVELWRKAFDSQRELYEGQLRAFQPVVVRWIDLVMKGFAPPKGVAGPFEAKAPAA